jgi:hypothetical protein
MEARLKNQKKLRVAHAQRKPSRAVAPLSRTTRPWRLLRDVDSSLIEDNGGQDPVIRGYVRNNDRNNDTNNELIFH